MLILRPTIAPAERTPPTPDVIEPIIPLRTNSPAKSGSLIKESRIKSLASKANSWNPPTLSFHVPKLSAAPRKAKCPFTLNQKASTFGASCKASLSTPLLKRIFIKSGRTSTKLFKYSSVFQFGSLYCNAAKSSLSKIPNKSVTPPQLAGLTAQPDPVILTSKSGLLERLATPLSSKYPLNPPLIKF